MTKYLPLFLQISTPNRKRINPKRQGKACRDAKTSLKKCCKMEISFWQYYKDRIENKSITESSQTMVIHDMKGKILVAELKHLLDNSGTNDLFRSHPFCTFISFYTVWGKVLHRQIIDGRVPVKNAAYGVQLFSLRMINLEGHQRHLFFANFSHFVVAPFLFLVVLLISCTFTYTTKREFCPL